VNYFLQQVINALGWGSILAILAAGYTMTFGIIGLVNFAHGEVFMAGAFAAYFILTVFELPFWLGVIACLAGSVIIGLIIERIAFKPVRGAGLITLFITSLGASIAVRNSTVIAFSDRLRSFVFPEFLKGIYQFGGLMIQKKVLVIFLVTVAICAVLLYLVKKTKVGIAMRSISYNSRMAESLGINSEKIIIITFIISSALAGIAALLWGVLFGSIQASMGALAVVNAFIACVVGGVGNVFGAMVSGYILGVGGALFIAFLPPDLVGLRPLFVWIVFFILLILKPSGLFRANIR